MGEGKNLVDPGSISPVTFKVIYLYHKQIKIKKVLKNFVSKSKVIVKDAEVLKTDNSLIVKNEQF